jgi:hypothetical protein
VGSAAERGTLENTLSRKMGSLFMSAAAKRNAVRISKNEGS